MRQWWSNDVPQKNASLAARRGDEKTKSNSRMMLDKKQIFFATIAGSWKQLISATSISPVDLKITPVSARSSVTYNINIHILLFVINNLAERKNNHWFLICNFLTNVFLYIHAGRPAMCERYKLFALACGRHCALFNKKNKRNPSGGCIAFLTIFLLIPSKLTMFCTYKNRWNSPSQNFNNKKLDSIRANESTIERLVDELKESKLSWITFFWFRLAWHDTPTDKFVPHFELSYLSTGGSRKVIHYLNVSRYFEVSDFSLGVRLQSALRNLRVCVQSDAGTNFLAVDVVVDPENMSLQYCWMRLQKMFNFLKKKIIYSYQDDQNFCHR